MKGITPIKGFIEYNKKDCPFLYENGILQIFPPNKKVWMENKVEIFNQIKKMADGYIQSDKWIDTVCITGKTKEEYGITFYVLDDSSNDNGFFIFTVLFFYEYKSNRLGLNNIYGISLEGRELDYFYPSNSVFQFYTNMKNLSKSVNILPKENELIGEYEYKNTNVQIWANVNIDITGNSNNPLFSKTQFRLCFSEPKSIDFTLDIYYHFKLFIQYVCNRRNVKINNINVLGKIDGKYSNDGIIEYIENDNLDENDLNEEKRIIQYKYLKNNLNRLFEDISKGNIYFEYLCSSIAETNSYNISRIIQMFVAFEREYRNIFPEELERSEEYINTKNEIIETLKNIKENYEGKKKKYIKAFIKTIEKIDNSYASRVKKALLNCEEILKPFLNSLYKDYKIEILDDIADRMNELRNDCAHGNIDLKIEPININDFKIFECLIYAVRLKFIGLEKNNIQNSINELMNFRLAINEKDEIE